MAKIVQVLTRPSAEYRQDVADAQVRDLDGVIQKLNTTYQQELKDEMEAENYLPLINKEVFSFHLIF